MSTKKVQSASHAERLPVQLLKPSILKQAIALFSTRFGYKFTGESTKPPDAIALDDLSAADGEHRFLEHAQEHVAEFLKRMLASQKVPDWMLGQAEEDLLHTAKDIIPDANDSKPRSVALRRTYNPEDPSQSNSFETNAVILCTNIKVSEKGKVVNEVIVAYVGVYYEVLTQLALVTQQLRADAYRQASSILMHGNEKIIDDVELAHALGSYAGDLFKDKFQYPWGQSPPGYIDDGSFMKVKLDALGYFEDGKTNTVDDFVKDTLLKDVSIPEWTAENVVNDILFQFDTTIQGDALGRSWPDVKIDRPFYDLTGNNKSVNDNAIMVFYSYSKTLYDGRVVKITYIYWMGMIYEKLPLRTVLYNDMILQLFNHLHDSMPSVPSDDLTSDKEGLITLLSRCESVNFKSAFKYDFKGNSTNPSDNNGDEVYGVAVFGEFEEVSESIISQWTKEEIFKDNTFPFFNSVPAIKTKLDQQIVFWLTQNGGTTQDNNWGHEKFAKLYGHPSDSSKELHTRVFVSYANASLARNGAERNTNLFYYMGIYYVADSDSDGV